MKLFASCDLAVIAMETGKLSAQRPYLYEVTGDSILVYTPKGHKCVLYYVHQGEEKQLKSHTRAADIAHAPGSPLHCQGT